MVKTDTKYRHEQNALIMLNALRRVISVFSGPFMTAYLIRATSNNLASTSLYYIMSYFVMGICFIVVAKLFKHSPKINLLRFGVILNFAYVLSIIILRDSVAEHIPILAIIYGIATSCYWLPYITFTADKVSNKEQTDYAVNLRNITCIVETVIPLVLGGIITVTNFYIASIVILLVSILQLICSFRLTPDTNARQTMPFQLTSVWRRLIKNRHSRSCLLSELFIGASVSNSALGTIMTVYIVYSFHTDFALGLITSLTTIVSVVLARLYRHCHGKNNTIAILLASLISMLAVFVMVFIGGDTTVIVGNLLYTALTNILLIAREVCIYNTARSSVVGKSRQTEFIAIRECAIELGRVFSYSLLPVASLIGGTAVLNVTIVILTLAIPTAGIAYINVAKCRK